MNSKLGIHVQTRPHGWKQFVKEAKPIIVKCMDPGIADEWEELIADIRQQTGWPDFDIFLLGRIQVHQSLDNPEQSAQDLWNTIRQRTTPEKRKLFDAWEGYNETGTGSAHDIRKLARFDAEFTRILHDNDLKSAVGGFSHSNPRLSIWRDYFETALEHADFLHLHEYSWPTMQAEEGNRCLYYRRLYAELPQELRRPLIITECGLDSMAAGVPGPHKGWRNSGSTAAQYMAQLAWYDGELQKDDYIIGATIFTYGSTPTWRSFDVHEEDSQGHPAGIHRLLQDYLGEQNKQPHHWWWVGAPAPEPVEEEEPKPILAHQKVGIDVNRPINPATGAVEGPSAQPQILAGTGAHWLRLNFVRGPWGHPNDAPFKTTYGGIIQGFAEAWGGEGPLIYALVGAETAHHDPRNLLRYPPVDVSWAVSGFTSAARDKIKAFVQQHVASVGQTPEQWIAQYAEHFAAVVQAFRDRVQVFETFNEPDDWHRFPPEDNENAFGNPWSQSWVHPYWLAQMLQAIYDLVKQHGVKVVSGPLQGFTGNWHGKVSYLRSLYDAGQRLFDWGDSDYPFHGIGYHLYVHEGFDPDKDQVAQKIAAEYKAHLDAIEGVVKQFEGQDADRKLYISEFGWPTPNADSEEQQGFQAHAMHTAFDILKADPRVAAAIWFCTQDFPGKHYGLYKMGALGPSTAKTQPLTTFQTIAKPPEVEAAPEITFAAASQDFEHGRMIWRADQLRIDVLYDDNTWVGFDDTFDPGADLHSANLSPPAGLLEPVRGFGKVWREQPGVRERLGWATQPEKPLTGRKRSAEKMWVGEEAYLLVDDGTFEALPG